jgi:nucleotide-binding universal stress UspA family protein
MTASRFGRILCAVDFSDLSAAALSHAAALARWAGSRLAVVHVVAPPDFRLVDGRALDVDARAQRLTRLRAFVEEAAGPFGPALALREGEPAAEIAAECLAWSADLLVVGTHARRGLEHWEMGSVAEQLIRRAPCPVLTVPRGSHTPVRAGEPPFGRVLCALDLGPTSATTLEHALALGLRARAEVTVVHAMEELPADSRRLELRLGVPWTAAYRETVERQARARLLELLPPEVRRACEVTEIVVPGRARHQVVRAARESGADLVVMGSGGVSLIPFGSWVAQVVRSEICPVLPVASGFPARAAGLARLRRTAAQPAH